MRTTAACFAAIVVLVPTTLLAQSTSPWEQASGTQATATVEVAPPPAPVRVTVTTQSWHATTRAPWGASAVPVQSLDAERPAQPVDTTQAPAEPPQENNPARYLLQPLAGFGVGTAMAFGGGLAGLAFYGFSSHSHDDGMLAVLYVAGGALLGYTFGVPLGVTAVGRAYGRNGGYGWALLGSAAGRGLTIAAAAAITAGGEGSSTAFGVASLLLPVVGSMVGFELSTDSGHSTRRVASRTGVRMMPSLAPVSGGALAGLSGTF